jgi:hypothetical protein
MSQVKTALAPEGPWSEPVTVHKPKPVQDGGNIYAAVPHQYFDPSGKTLIITYTNHPNTIQAIKVVSFLYSLRRSESSLTVGKEF